MKTFILCIAFLMFTDIWLVAQSGMTIRSGGAVTVNGNTYIVPTVFTCGSPMIDSRDNHFYNTVQIGTQCWMAQNLNVGTKISVLDNQTNNGIIEKYCYYDDENNCNTYGGLYQWNEMMNFTTTEGAQGICPTSWHIPTDAEWTTLTTFLGGENIAGGIMKEAGTTHWSSPNTGATNSSGFTALPSGARYDEGWFFNLTYDVTFWTSSQNGSTNAWQRYLHTFGENVHKGFNTDISGFSVRCLKN